MGGIDVQGRHLAHVDRVAVDLQAGPQVAEPPELAGRLDRHTRERGRSRVSTSAHNAARRQ